MTMAALLAHVALSAAPVDWPSVWGIEASRGADGCSGHLFGFSGMDGPTSESDDFVGIFARGRSASSHTLHFCGLDVEVGLTVSLPSPPTSVSVATNDVLRLSCGGSEAAMAWVASDLLAGSSPPNSTLSLAPNATRLLAGRKGHGAAPSGPTCEVAGAFVALCVLQTQAGMKWGLAYNKDKGAAVTRAATAACAGDACSEQRQRVAWAQAEQR